jgi:hypothetical protein
MRSCRNGLAQGNRKAAIDTRPAFNRLAAVNTQGQPLPRPGNAGHQGPTLAVKVHGQDTASARVKPVGTGTSSQ